MDDFDDAAWAEEARGLDYENRGGDFDKCVGCGKRAADRGDGVPLCKACYDKDFAGSKEGQ